MLPKHDRQDILDEHPCFNNGKKPSPEHQHHPEFSQCSYHRLRSLEEVYPCRNYLEDLKASKSSAKKHQITEHVRSFGIQKIFDLHQKKEYKEETVFIAAGIFDRYIAMVGADKFDKS